MTHTIHGMQEAAIKRLPGGEIVLAGSADLESGRDTPEAAALRMASTRLAAVGIDVSSGSGPEPAAHHLYELLRQEVGDEAHSRFNAIAQRLDSFLRAAERAAPG